MAQPWDAEVVVSAALAVALVEAQFPQLAPVRAEPLGAGFDNTAYRVNGAYVFRFPRRQLAVPCLEAEIRLLPTLASRLPLPIPAPVFVGRPSEAYPWPFAGYVMLPGRTACAAGLDQWQREAAAEPLARFLAALHAVPAEGTGLGPDTFGRLDLARRVPWARETLGKFAGAGEVPEADRLLALLAAAPDHYRPRAGTLVHGDLYSRHLLVDEGGRLAGVIDWGDVHLGDPAVDLAVAFTFLPPAARQRFRASYGPIDGDAWSMARLRGLWHSAAVLKFALAIGDADLAREGRQALAYVAGD